MFERFTDRSRRVMGLANRQAKRLSSPIIDTVHIVLGLLEDGAGVGVAVLKNLGVDVADATRAAEHLAGPQFGEHMTLGKQPLTPAAKQIIVQSIEIARELGHDYVGTEHLTLALARDADGPGPRVFGAFNVTADMIRAEVLKVLATMPARPPMEQAKAWRPPYIRHMVVWLWVLSIAVVVLFVMLLKK